MLTAAQRDPSDMSDPSDQAPLAPTQQRTSPLCPQRGRGVGVRAHCGEDLSLPELRACYRAGKAHCRAGIHRWRDWAARTNTLPAQQRAALRIRQLYRGMKILEVLIVETTAEIERDQP